MKTDQIKSQIQRFNRKLTRIATAVLLSSGILTGQRTLAAQPGSSLDSQLRSKVNHIVVIYQENWSFDSLYGQFPGVNGLANGFDTLPQVDKAAG